MADRKGKGICYDDDDDEPIILEDQVDDDQIQEYRLSLIGKMLNPFKQNVAKLIEFMPTQWKMQDRIVSMDLGNGRNFVQLY